MLYKGYVSCSGLISSVGETEMILLGFREDSLMLKLESLQRHSISQCNIYFFSSVCCFLLTAGATCPLSAHKAILEEVRMCESIAAFKEGCHRSCQVLDVTPYSQRRCANMSAWHLLLRSHVGSFNVQYFIWEWLPVEINRCDSLTQWVRHSCEKKGVLGLKCYLWTSAQTIARAHWRASYSFFPSWI